MNFKGTLANADQFKIPMSSISEVVDEATLCFDKEGITLKASDKAMVCLVDMKIPKGAFIEYSLDKDLKVGLDMPTLKNVLKRFTSKDEIVMTEDSNVFTLGVNGSAKRKFTVPEIDVSEQEVPDINELEFDSSGTFNTKLFIQSVEDAATITDSIRFSVNDSKSIKIESSENSRSYEVCLENIDTKSILDKGSSSTYPYDFLRKVLKSSKISDDIKMEFGYNYPARITMESAGTAIAYVVAPRVIDD